MSKSPRYFYNQNQTKGICSLDGMCDGQRKCNQYGKCVGIARPEKNILYKFDQKIVNNRCPKIKHMNYSIKDFFCNGTRICQDGLCVDNK